ncbi:unnamed protein product, partial [marine sediment metagenome]
MGKAMKWRLINSGYLDGYTNMAIDEAMFTLRATNDMPPTLRLYGWRPPAISVGYFQELEGIKLEDNTMSGLASVVTSPTSLLLEIAARTRRMIFPERV